MSCPYSGLRSGSWLARLPISIRQTAPDVGDDGLGEACRGRPPCLPRGGRAEAQGRPQGVAPTRQRQTEHRVQGSGLGVGVGLSAHFQMTVSPQLEDEGRLSVRARSRLRTVSMAERSSLGSE